MNAKVEPQTATDWIAVCDQQDLIPNVGVCAKVNDRQVAIFMLQDAAGNNELFAIDNYDPKSSANVLSRGIVGDLKGHKVVASPIYKNHFDLQTGKCLEEDYSIPVYTVRTSNGKIQVAV
jgi:nitrite reductase (NADH) small subunit